MWQLLLKWGKSYRWNIAGDIFELRRGFTKAQALNKQWRQLQLPPEKTRSLDCGYVWCSRVTVIVVLELKTHLWNKHFLEDIFASFTPDREQYNIIDGN